MEDFRILENETKRCNSIKELFDIWQKAHMVDDDFADNCVFSDEEAKSNFCEDGKLAVMLVYKYGHKIRFYIY